jgi:hypothetical protein
METPDDVKTVLNAYCNYVGHRNVLKQALTDAYLLKALEIGAPENALDMFKFHAELMVHPHNRVVSKYLDFFTATNNYAKIKAFFEVTRGKFLLDRPFNLNATIIEHAFASKDKETVIAAYLDVLDYKRELREPDTFVKVLESMDYSKCIDHVLFGHLKDQMDQRGFDCRIY